MQESGPPPPPAVPEGPALALYHYNGLAAAGHSHKRALRAVQLRLPQRGVASTSVRSPPA